MPFGLGLEVELVFHRGVRVVAAASAAALTAFTLAAGPPALAGQVHAATAATASAARAAATGGAVKVLLPTGDVVLLSAAPGGRQTASVIKAQKSGPGAVFQMFNEGKDLYVVPQSAVPYLGSTMSPSLFDVTQLAQQEQGTLSLAVQLTLRSTADRAAVPGVTITHHAGLAATGRLTVASARAFGVALARQAERDHASATHAAGLFAGLARIVPAQAPATASAVAATHHVRPDYQMYTLTLNGIDSAGKKDSGDDVIVYNVDNLLKYTGDAVFSNGQAKISVPEGQYSAICQFYNFNTGAVSAVTLGQFTVSGDTSQTVDARTATSPVSVTTPRPASPAVLEVAIARSDKLGQYGSNSFLGDGQTTFTVTPVTSGITAGQLNYYVYDRAFSPASAKSPYTYDVEFPSSGAIPVNQAYTAQASGLATVRSSYPAMQPDTQALDTRFGSLPWQTFLFAADVNLTTPLQRTEYYTALPDLTWSGDYNAVFSASPFELLSEFDSSWTSYQPGTTSSTVWGGQPEHPRLLETPLYVNQVICPACLNGDTLNLIAFPFSDNDPAHRSYPDGATPGLTESESYQVSADGVQVSHGTGFFQDKVALPAGSKDVSISYDTTRSSSTMTQSTSTATTWTVRTGAPQGALPADWYCDTDLHTKCGVLPLMFADYDLPVNLLGQLAPGPVTAGIDVSHLAGASDVAVKSLTVQVSFNGGTGWQKATVTALGSGQYSVSFTVPAAASTDGFGALKLSAADAYGGTLSQTIQHAFAVAAS
jgi:hypothetical protein